MTMALLTLGSMGAQDAFLDQEIEELSFYMGYLMGQEHAKRALDFPTCTQKVLEGMQAAINGEPVLEKERLQPIIKRMQKSVIEKKVAAYLAEAETYLEEVVIQEPNLVELVPQKLYYQVHEEGAGKVIGKRPNLHFKVSVLKEGQWEVIYSSFEDQEGSFEIDLNTTVAAFL